MPATKHEKYYEIQRKICAERGHDFPKKTHGVVCNRCLAAYVDWSRPFWDTPFAVPKKSRKFIGLLQTHRKNVFRRIDYVYYLRYKENCTPEQIAKELDISLEDLMYMVEHSPWFPDMKNP